VINRIRSFCWRLAQSCRRGSDPPEDRRAWERLPALLEVSVHADTSGPVQGRMCDVSRGGMRLLVGRRIDRGAMIRVDLPLPAGHPRATVLACVVHVETLADGTYEIGCSFAGELSNSELEALEVRRPSVKATDKRTWDRLPAVGRVVYGRVYYCTEPREAEIHNISPAGVAILAAEPLTPGHLLELDLRDRDDRPVLSIAGCVVYAAALEPERWLVGCNFISELTDDEMRSMTADGI
jgi:PilZ domain